MGFRCGCADAPLKTTLRIIPGFTLYTPPTAHNIATSEAVVIFTSHLKRGNEGPFCSPNAFNSDFDNSTRLKRSLC